MNWVLAHINEKHGILAYHPPLSSPSTSFASHYSNSFQKESSPPSSSSIKISPTAIFIIVIIAVVFFLSALLHLLIRFLIKHHISLSPSSQSNRYPETPASDALQRQLQNLFHLHDSGLDQAFIDALPVFLYKEIMGLKEPFDCAVCLSEFSEDDMLRLLPFCSHAFHLNCIDTWLLSNSTCPLCRGILFGSGLVIENPVFDFDDSRENDGVSGDWEDGFSSSAGQKAVEIEEAVGEKRVFPVRLGKFRSLNGGGEGEEGVIGESSSSNLDARRCYSMGSFQYVVGDSNLQVALCQDRDGDNKHQQFKRRETSNRVSSIEVDLEGKKLWKGSKVESFSVSKIWLWSKKGKFSDLSNDTQMGIPPFNLVLPWIERTQDV